MTKRENFILHSFERKALEAQTWRRWHQFVCAPLHLFQRAEFSHRLGFWAVFRLMTSVEIRPT